MPSRVSRSRVGVREVKGPDDDDAATKPVAAARGTAARDAGGTGHHHADQSDSGAQPPLARCECETP